MKTYLCDCLKGENLEKSGYKECTTGYKPRPTDVDENGVCIYCEHYALIGPRPRSRCGASWKLRHEGSDDYMFDVDTSRLSECQ